MNRFGTSPNMAANTSPPWLVERLKTWSRLGILRPLVAPVVPFASISCDASAVSITPATAASPEKSGACISRA